MKRAFASLILTVGILIWASASQAQRIQPAPTPRPAPPPAAPETPEPSKAYAGYMVGVGDLLNVRVAEDDSITGRYQVNPAGDLELPLLKKPIRAAGTTTFELSKLIRKELQVEDMIKDPSVTVFIERGMSQNITLLGQVQRPGTYPIERPTTLIDAISMAGGLTPMAGQIITVNEHSVRPVDTSPVEASAVDANAAPPAAETERVISIDLPELMSGARPTANVLVHAGAVITVSNAATIYVVGAVVKPGAFTVQDQESGLTVMRAIALVEGTQPTASTGKSVIVRQSHSSSERQEIPVNLDEILKGKAKDPLLQANDILFVPQSGFKKTMRRVGDVAVIAAGEIIGYGVGLRIAH